MKKEEKEKIEQIAARLDELAARLKAVEKGVKELLPEILYIRADLQMIENLDFSHLDEAVNELVEACKNLIPDFELPPNL